MLPAPSPPARQAEEQPAKKKKEGKEGKEKKEKKEGKKRKAEAGEGAAVDTPAAGEAGEKKAKKAKKAKGGDASGSDGEGGQAGGGAAANPLALDNFALSAPVKSLLRAKGIESLFEIQAACLPPLLEGADLVGRARTGCGKTLAFVLPIVERLCSLTGGEGGGARRPYGRAPSVVVLAPTRELAKQVGRRAAGVLFAGPGTGWARRWRCWACCRSWADVYCTAAPPAHATPASMPRRRPTSGPPTPPHPPRSTNSPPGGRRL